MFYDRAGGAIDVRRLHEQVGGAAGAHYTRSGRALHSQRDPTNVFARVSRACDFAGDVSDTTKGVCDRAKIFLPHTKRAPTFFFTAEAQQQTPRITHTR